MNFKKNRWSSKSYVTKKNNFLKLITVFCNPVLNRKIKDGKFLYFKKILFCIT